MSKEILKIINVSKSFNEVKALNGLNLSVNKNLIFGLVGPNGAGKTTLINCIASIIEHDKGIINIFSSKLSSDSLSIKRKVGFLFENVENLFVFLTGDEYLNFIADIYGIGKSEKMKRIKELLDFFDLTDHSNKLIYEYSKGMRKKVAFASILLYNPELYILDEPFDGLDTLTIIKVKKLIKQLKESGKTILITSHILSYIEDLADEVAIINKGEIVFQSPTKDIRTKFKNELTLETYNSLEEIFIDLTTEKKEQEKTLSWM